MIDSFVKSFLWPVLLSNIKRACPLKRMADRLRSSIRDTEIGKEKAGRGPLFDVG